MALEDNETSCLAVCWTLGGMVGLGLAVAFGGGLPALVATLIGVAIAVGVAMFLQRTVCGLAAEHWGPFEGLKGVPGWDAPEPAEAKAAPAAPAPAASAPAAKPAVASSLLAGETELAARKGEWRYGGSGDAAAREPETDEDETAGEPPALYALADPSQADDLKRINGVGPKLEEKLNAVGVHHFHQIAAWTPAQVAWMDDKLSFKGRIERDDWIGQAAVLAEEGNKETGAA